MKLIRGLCRQKINRQIRSEKKNQENMHDPLATNVPFLFLTEKICFTNGNGM